MEQQEDDSYYPTDTPQIPSPQNDTLRRYFAWRTDPAQLATNFYAQESEAPEQTGTYSFKTKGSSMHLESGFVDATFNRPSDLATQGNNAGTTGSILNGKVLTLQQRLDFQESKKHSHN